jgi:enoyl-CoA hydratase/carnithine racemase
VLAILRCTKPTIVALNGPAAGLGVTMTLAAAIRVAWSGAKVAVPFSRRGLTIESCGAFFLPRLIGLSNAMHLTTTGATYAVTDPLVGGLFSKLLPTPEETVAHAIDLATDIAENTSVASTKLMRDMMLYCPATPEETHILDSRVLLSAVGTKDNVEGVRSFMEKRKPVFSGTIDEKDFPFWPWWRTETTETAGHLQELKAKI